MIVFIGLIEFLNFLPSISKNNPFFKVLFIGSGLISFASSYFDANYLLAAFWCSGFALLAYLLLLVREEQERKAFFQSQLLALFGLFYCALSPALVARLLLLPHGADWLLTLLAIVFFGDSFAFFAGFLFGKQKLHPVISPKKTWAGSIGGVIGSTLFGTLFCYWFLPPQYLSFDIIWISALTGSIGQIGDLIESLIKREVGVKDSGRIMPGHGGVLDRIDGVITAGPIFFFLIKFLYFYN